MNSLFHLSLKKLCEHNSVLPHFASGGKENPEHLKKFYRCSSSAQTYIQGLCLQTFELEIFEPKDDVQCLNVCFLQHLIMHLKNSQNNNIRSQFPKPQDIQIKVKNKIIELKQKFKLSLNSCFTHVTKEEKGLIIYSRAGFFYNSSVLSNFTSLNLLLPSLCWILMDKGSSLLRLFRYETVKFNLHFPGGQRAMSMDKIRLEERVGG